MPFRRMRKYRKAKKYIRRRLYKKRFQPKKHFFSETFQASDLVVNKNGSSSTVGQTWTAQMDSITQFAEYKTLYQKYRIRKLEWIFCPLYGTQEVNQAELNLANATNANTSVTLHYRKTWVVPLKEATSELDMLGFNGVKSINLRNSVKRISMRNPTTQDGILQQQGGVTSLYFHQKNRWCSFDDPTGQGTTGNLIHGGLLTYVTTNGSSGSLQDVGETVARVYCKVYFEVASPR